MGDPPDPPDIDLGNDEPTNIANHVTYTDESSGDMDRAGRVQVNSQQVLKEDSSDDNITEEIISSDSSDEVYNLNKEGFYDKSADYKMLVEDSQRQLNETAVHYKKLYEECKQQNEILHKRITTVSNKNEDLLMQFSDLTEEYKTMKDQYQRSLEEQDATIQALNKSIAECDKNLSKAMVERNKNDIETLVSDYEEKLKAKDNEITTLNNHGNREQLKKISNTDILFNMTRKASAKNLTDVNKCDVPSCGSTNVDLIKCNKCSKFACEPCNNVQVAKLKPIMKKCNTVYFVCDMRHEHPK